MNFTERIRQASPRARITFELLSKRSGVPISTLKAIFKKGVEHASFANVAAIAGALEVGISISSELDSYSLLHQQAVKKARELVGMVQGTSALEAQAVDASQIEQMVQQLVHRLMAGSRRKLWA